MAARRPATIGLDHYVRCQSPRCMSAAVIYADMLIPLCLDHAEAVYRHLCDALPTRARYERATRNRTGRTTAAPPGPPRLSLVYYAAIGVRGEFIKIGYTASPLSRWSSLRNQYGDLTILVVEPGGVEQEVARQAQFSHLREGQSELFRTDPYLTAHVQRLRGQHPDWPEIAQSVHSGFQAVAQSKTGKCARLRIPGLAA